MDEVWYVDTPENIRLERALADSTRIGENTESIQRMIDIQKPILERARAKATVIIHNSGDKNSLVDQIEKAIAVSALRSRGNNEAMKSLGGIDLNTKNMDLDFAKDDQGVEMKFDSAMIAVQKGDFSGIVPVVIHITPITKRLAIIGND